MPARRRILYTVLFLVVAAITGALVAFIILNQAEPPVAPVQNVSAEPEEPVEPLKQEMACVDGVLNNNRLEANQVQAAIDGCR